MSESSDQPAPAPAPPSKSAGGKSAGGKSADGKSADDPNAAEANKIIRTHAIASVASGLLVGVPLLSVGLLVGAHLRMIRKLAKLYEVEYSEQRAKSILGSLLGVSAAGTLVTMLRAVVPALGALSVLAFSPASTYALGKVFTEHFASGGTFLTFDPERAKERYQEALEEKKKEEESYVGIKP